VQAEVLAVQRVQLQAEIRVAELQAQVQLLAVQARAEVQQAEHLRVFRTLYKTYPDLLTVHRSLNKTYLYLTCQK
jgi:hypothetical protein